MEKNRLMEKEILITICIIAVIVISAVAVYFYLPREDDEDNDLPTIDRAVKFPDDEGEHYEFFEIWEFYTRLETDNGNKIYLLTTCTNFTQNVNAHVSYEYLDIDNVTGIEEYITYTEGGNLSAIEGDMDMSFSGTGATTKITRVEKGIYDFVTRFDNGIKIKLSMHHKRDPILLGEVGKLYQIDFGTLFGYYQPDFEVQGEIYKDGVKIEEVNGKAWLEHIWGGEVKPFSTEQWQIQLDNSVEIFLFKGYDPNVEYPNDLFMHSLNVIRNDGEMKTPRLGDDIFLSYKEYELIQPAESNTLARAYKVVLYNENINLTIYPYPDKSIHSWNYLGFCKVEGVFYGESVSGHGICEFSKKYTSDPQIEQVRDDFDPLNPDDPVNILTNISYTPPVEPTDISLNYRTDGGEWKNVQMNYENGYWRATIPAQNYGTTVEYYISVTDQADKRRESDIREYYVDYT